MSDPEFFVPNQDCFEVLSWVQLVGLFCRCSKHQTIPVNFTNEKLLGDALQIWISPVQICLGKI